MMIEEKCKVCNLILYRMSRDKRGSTCNNCLNEKARKYKADNYLRLKNYNTEKYKAYRQKMKQCSTQKDCIKYVHFNHVRTSNLGSKEKIELRKNRLSKDEIKEILESQNYKCKITQYNFLDTENPLLRPSIDRIDSEIGYIKENCQIICTGLNLMKRNNSDKELIEFINILKGVKE